MTEETKIEDRHWQCYDCRQIYLNKKRAMKHKCKKKAKKYEKNIWRKRNND